VIIFIVPKNSGLQICKDIAKAKFPDKKISSVRGEDVAFVVERISKEGKEVIGITGEDLYKEFLLNYKNPAISVLETIKWKDSSALYGRPALCLLGPKGKKLRDLGKKLKVGINRKYSKLSKKFLSRIQYSEGLSFERLYFSGGTEEAFENGICDIIIDIVYSGKSAEKSGLEIYDKIFESDIVIIGKKEDFTLKSLYDVICKRIKTGNEKSYTKKLVGDLNLLKRKIIEEAGEVVTAKNKDELIWECADLIYFLFVIMAKNEIGIEDVEVELKRRRGK